MMPRQGKISPASLLLVLAVVAGACYLVARLVQPDEEPKGAPPTVQTPSIPSGTETKVEPKNPEKVDTTPDPIKKTPDAPVQPVGKRGEPTELAGYVRSLEGRPIPGALVQIVDYSYDRDTPNKRIQERMVKVVKLEVTTDQTGLYKLKALTPGHKHYLVASAPGFISQIKDSVSVGLLADFSLAPGARVEGVVKDGATGEPVAQVRVRGWYKTAQSLTDVNRLFRWEETVRSDKDGKFAFEGAPIEKILFQFWHDEFEDFQEEQVVVSGKTNAFEFKLKKGIVLRGTVKSKTDGKPVTNATVRIQSLFVPRSQASTDEQGVFVARGVERGDQMLLITAPGYSDTRVSRKITDADDFDAAKNNLLELAIDPCGRTAGRILGPEGNPIVNARVFVGLQNPLTCTVRGLSEATTDREGRYLIKNLNAGASYKICAHAEGLGFGVSDAIVVGPDEIRDNVDIRVRRGASISGTVTNEVNQPIAGARLTIDIPPYQEVWFPPGSELGQQSQRTLVTNGEGRFELVDIWRGSFTFAVDHAEHVSLTQQHVVVREPEQQVTQDFSLRIGRFISGSVTNASGGPAEGATVSAMRPWSDKPEGMATVDQRGNYRISGLVKGQYRVQAKLDGFSSRALPDVPSDSSGVNLSLVELGAVAGYVVGPDGRPVTDFMVTLHAEEPPQAPGGKPVVRRGPPQSFSDPGGRFLFERVDPGTYHVVAVAQTFGRVSKSGIVVSGGGPVDAGLFQMPKGGTFRGKLVDANGAGVSDAMVTVNNQTAMRKLAEAGIDPVKEGKGEDGDTGAVELGGLGEQTSWSARAGPDGEFVILGLSPGTYIVRITSQRHVPPPEDNFNVEEGQEVTRTYTMPIGAQIQLTLHDDFGEPVVAADARLREAESGRRVAETGMAPRSDAQGRLTLSNVRPGRYLVAVNRAGFLMKEIEVTIKEGEVITQSVTLEKFR